MSLFHFLLANNCCFEVTVLNSPIQNLNSIYFFKNMYRITLIQGEFFAQGQPQSDQFFKSLFEHFSLLSWLNQQSQLQIIDSHTFQSKQAQITTYRYSLNNHSSLKKLAQFNKNPQNRTICYLVADELEDDQIARRIEDQNARGQHLLKVVMSKHKETSKLKRISKQKDSKAQTQTVIYIDIEDACGFFEKMATSHFDKTISLKKALKDNEIEYFYKEPLSRRNKETQCCHFNLAFQGGGAKGVSYVGVYKALKELHKGIPINSIIGSSAGGILALAISTEMKPEAITQLCLEMETIPKDKYYKSEEQITPEAQAQFDTQIQKLKCILHNQGILEDRLFQQLISIMSDLQTSEKILKVLNQINPSLQKLFTLEIKPTEKKGFTSTKVYTKRFNYYGFLRAGLMQGNAVQQIASKCLIDYFCKHFNDRYKKKSSPEVAHRTQKIKNILQSWGVTTEDEQQLQIIFSQQEYVKKIKTITLKQLYDITQVELTCTSVDLDDKILRFFNHKTTPDLPVCKSVQMGGSFPVAFLAQKWQKEWGKYYIHYKQTRKEIDLTGHTFTDGGLLANFPVKYLDNELMRPMYFSHKRNPKYTILYGFGLDQIQQKRVDLAAQQLKKEAISELKEHISSKLSKLELIKNLILSDSNKELPKAKLEEIPVLDYLVKLISTFSVADYNLNIECFQKNIIVTEIERQLISSCKRVNQEVTKFNQLKEYLQTLEQCTLTKKNADPADLIRRSCTRAIDMLNEFQTAGNDFMERLKNQLLVSLYNYQGTRMKYQLQQSAEVNAAIRQAENIYSPQIFKIQQTSVKPKLIQCIKKIQAYFCELSGESKNEVKFVMDKMIQQQLAILSTFSSKVKAVIQALTQHGEEITNQLYNKCTSIDYDLIFQLANMESKFFIIDQPYVREILSNIYQLDLPIVRAENQILEHMSQIKAQLNSVIKHGEHNKIHLVLQSKQHSHFYFCSLFEILQNVLHQPQNIHKTIDMITTSGLQSIFAFLYAGGKKISNIRKEMWKIKDLITIQENIAEEYNTFSWAKTSGREMQELLQLTWSDHYHIFDQLQKYLLQQGNLDLAKEIDEMRVQFLYSKGVVTNNMEEILDFVTRSCYEAIKIKGDAQLQKKRLAQFLSLKNGKKGKDYKVKNQMISENTQNLIKMMMQHFEGILVGFLLNHSLISNTFDCSDPITAEKAWKGTIVKKLLSSKKLQLYIKKMLQQMRLNSNTTLAEYYDFCPRKITLNFALINKNKERVEMVNRFTRPNMPVWAAIIASTSMPLLLPDVDFLQQWDYSPFLDSRMRKLVNYFFSSPEDKLQQSYFSANFVSSLPLELLTNHKLAKENYTDMRQKQQRFYHQNKLAQSLSTKSQITNNQKSDQNQFTFITFSFKVNEKPKEANPQKGIIPKKKFLNLSNLLNLGVDLMRGKFKNVEVGFKDIMRRLQVTKNISIRLQCHDNTIMNLYFDQTVKLPIELGTLDFYKIQQGKDSILHHCIYQSQFVVRGIFQNLWISQDRKQFGYLSNKQVYMQYLLFGDQIQLKFISKSKWNKKLATMYRVFWKLNLQDSYTEYDGDQIVFSANHKLAYLKFDYPDMENIVRKSHEMVLNFQKLAQVRETVFFKFNYEKLDKRFLIPIPLFSERLKTRVIPDSNAIISESKIQEISAQLMIKSYKLETQQKLDPIFVKKDQVYQVELPQLEGQLTKKKTTFYLSEDKFRDLKPESQEEVKQSPYLFIKTLVDLKNDGLLCQACIKPLKRSQNNQSNRIKPDNVQMGDCSKCKKVSILGFECKNKDCKQRDNNRFCFKCLFVYLFQIQDGICRCRQQKHELEFVPLQAEKQVILCHFCQSAALSYYRDHECNINLCFKCSLVLDSKRKY